MMKKNLKHVAAIVLLVGFAVFALGSLGTSPGGGGGSSSGGGGGGSSGCPSYGTCSTTHTWNPSTETWTTSTNHHCSRSMCDAIRSKNTPWHGTYRCDC